MVHSVKTAGVCAREIQFELKNNSEQPTVENIHFVGGCEGNLKTIASLLEGMPVQDVIKKLKGTTCGRKSTSCSDQLALALEKAAY